MGDEFWGQGAIIFGIVAYFGRESDLKWQMVLESGDTHAYRSLYILLSTSCKILVMVKIKFFGILVPMTDPTTFHHLS